MTRTLSGVDPDRRAFRSRCGATDETPSGRALLGRRWRERLGLERGRSVSPSAAGALSSTSSGDGPIPHRCVARWRNRSSASNGWWLIFAPPGEEKRRDLGQTFGESVGLPSTSDPSVGAGRRRPRARIRHRRRHRSADLRAELLCAVLRQGDRFDARPDLDDRARPRIRHRTVVVPRRGAGAPPRIRHHVQHRAGRRGALLLPGRIRRSCS